MTASSRGGRAVSALLKGSPKICSQCARLTPLQQRLYSAAATTSSSDAAAASPIQPPVSGSSSSSSPDLPQPPVMHYPQHAPSHYSIKSGVILTRPPLLTRSLHPFETAFFLYQKRLEERLSAPFRKGFYFRHDTPAELDWRIKVRERHGVAGRDVGRYNPRGRMGWNDEVLVGSPLGLSEEAVKEKILTDAEMRVSEDGEQIPEEDRVKVERPAPRRTESDEKGDVRKLDRALDRTLYLVVRKEGKGWQFPAGDVLTSENLHETAARILAESAGVNMNTWIVGRVPVAHVVNKPLFKKDNPEQIERKGEKVFFLKGRIMAGQADLAGNKHGLTDFRWLTREELQGVLPQKVYSQARLMMADR
ncbi:39S mitochondrial ribosomal protein L46-domain-containing protein [Coniochaeta sp. 2T2.1]|nr:39S mitochondrial ribosomal protein L46-domain-containing protein [Coniochaeta sp. 2T2.1]